MNYKSIKQYKLNVENPFIDETITHIEKGEKFIMIGNPNSDVLIDGETSEIKAHTVMAKKIKVDRAQFVKLYTSTITNFLELSKTGIRVFTFIASNIRPNADSFVMVFDECMKYTGYKSKKSIIQGLTELIDNDIIARSKVPYIYFINPTMFYNGDRLTLLEQYEVDENVKPKNLK